MMMLINGDEAMGSHGNLPHPELQAFQKDHFEKSNGEIQSIGLSDGNGSAIGNDEGRVR